MVDALSYLHANEQVHGNLLPEHVLFSTQALDVPLLVGYAFSTSPPHSTPSRATDMHSLGRLLLLLFPPDQLAPPEVADLQRKLLVADPAQRPSAEDVLQHALFHLPPPGQGQEPRHLRRASTSARSSTALDTVWNRLATKVSSLPVSPSSVNLLRTSLRAT